MIKEKKCVACKTLKSLSAFNKNKAKKDGLNNICRVCSQANSKKYYGLNREKHINRVKEYKKANLARTKAHNLGVKQSEVETILGNSDGKCAICLKEKPLCVDHDHETLSVRGLLCYQCNSALGLFYDNVSSLKRAIIYLEK